MLRYVICKNVKTCYLKGVRNACTWHTFLVCKVSTQRTKLHELDKSDIYDISICILFLKNTIHGSRIKAFACARLTCHILTSETECINQVVSLTSAFLEFGGDNVVCCERIGCFDSSTGPMSHLPSPDCPDDFGLKLLLMTRQNREIQLGQTITHFSTP